MARWKVGNGITKYIASLDDLRIHTKEIVGRSIYEGAKPVADAIRQGIRGIPIDSRRYVRSGQLRGISRQQKQGLLDGFGITKMRTDGGKTNVKIGMDGYNSQTTRKYPRGQPNALIARSVESGTSFRAKHPFIAPAIRKTRKTAEERMRAEFEKALNKF